MRVAYLKHNGLMNCSALCCLRPFLCFAKFRDIHLEIALFKRVYKPDDQIQALVNLGENMNQVEKITMSLYIMVEIKDPGESNQIWSKYTVTERLYEQVRDFTVDKAK